MLFYAAAEFFRCSWAKIRGFRLLATPEEAEDRIIECEGCDYYVSESQQCSSCGCFMPLKTLLAPSQCPKRKWLAILEKTASKQ